MLKILGAKTSGRYSDAPMDRDHVDALLEQWSNERPDLDASPIAVIARISRLARLCERRTEERFAAFGLGQGGFSVLAALRRAGRPYRLSPTDLYNSLLVSSGAMTNRIDRLEEREFVVRTPDPNDRRGVLVELTPKGKKVIDAAMSAHVEVEADLLKAFTPTEREQLASLLRKFALSVEGPMQPAAEPKSAATATDGAVPLMRDRRAVTSPGPPPA
jgi:DNA-binding MarR family transcriptional regulator